MIAGHSMRIGGSWNYQFRLLAGILAWVGWSSISGFASQTANLPESEWSPLATAGPKPPAIPPPKPETIDAAIARGIDFLLSVQNQNGSWGSAERTKDLNIFAPVPGAHHAFRAGVTSLSLMALIEYQSASFDTPSSHRAKAASAAIQRGESWLLEHLPNLRRSDGATIYNVWGHAYGLQALAHLANRPGIPEDRLAIYRSQVSEQSELLDRYHLVNGGWGYYDLVAQTKQPSGSPTCFTTATALIAIDEAKAFGAQVQEKTIADALASIRRQRKPDFSYVYGEYLRMRPMWDINRPAGSLGRSQVCNLALRLFGDESVTDDILKTWLNRLIARDGWQSIGRKKPIPHESFFHISGYFYYYGYYYAAMCVALLPENEQPYFQDHLTHILLPRQEKDGSWWDYPFYDYHQQYGTAMAVMTLLRCRK
ncbi:MAG: terpene cyclase/mutase family protein [Pirellulales bacterium]|nr:terpene cyclase/mutase family protein [Pirellulales bacterium]